MIDVIFVLIVFRVISVVALIFVLPLIAFWFVMLVLVLKRAGYSGWWSLSCLCTPIFVILIWVLAFADWPARQVILLPPKGRSDPSTSNCV